MKLSKRLISLTARVIAVVRVIDHNETHLPRYIQVDVLMWVPFTPIFFIKTIDGIDGNNEVSKDIIDFWKSKSFWIAYPFSIYLVWGFEFYKRPRLYTLSVPQRWRARKWSFVAVMTENGVTIGSPRSTAFMQLESKGYVRLDEFIQLIQRNRSAR